MKHVNWLMFIARVAVACVVSGGWLRGAGLEYLSTNANAVVVGSVTSRVEGLSQVSFTIEVARVLSGSVPGASVSVVHSWAGLLRGPARVLNQPLYGIWFLRSNAPGSWDVLTARPLGVRTILGLFLPASPTPPSGPYAYRPGTPVLDALVYEVAAGVQWANEDPALLVDAFDSTDVPAVEAVLNTCLASADPGFKAVGLAGMLERQRPGVIEQLVRLWPAISGDPHWRYVASALRDSWRDPTPDAVRQLTSMAMAAPVGDEARVAAVGALAAIHTKETLPFLAGLLSSGDPIEQAQAVYGLSSFANGCPMKTRGNIVSMAYLQCDQPGVYKTRDTVANFGFRVGTAEQQSALVSFWQAWWDNHRELH